MREEGGDEEREERNKGKRGRSEGHREEGRERRRGREETMRQGEEE